MDTHLTSTRRRALAISHLDSSRYLYLPYSAYTRSALGCLASSISHLRSEIDIGLARRPPPSQYLPSASSMEHHTPIQDSHAHSVSQSPLRSSHRPNGPSLQAPQAPCSWVAARPSPADAGRQTAVPAAYLPYGHAWARRVTP